ncbi:uncharacterized protein TRIADDRAFT_57456 [Trichoplax adhaerens]|uniref:NHR domain-containing protein n=1 Tax=Trichoplax adhaerens TaxID=10228 RepID=B3RZH6_TRIAD|nr:hypothetical protein TRIADDRAFT_57456 [Trichoplax adhaerens]EDV24207.1 hypothetical protein TRIADDRAFT_57456 [Trichoplax adhaerens]|eukprot:XP_002113733.1 hypothetical protein TRIADDRAFT_57456 [Trichoplax adhaerens]
MATFANHHGCLIQLSCNSKTARRNKAESEFNNGLVITDRCISDGQLFQVHIDRKINLWSGSLAIGVVCNFSDEINLPTSAVGFTNDAWIYYENSIFKNEIVCIDSYGTDLNSLNEGDSVGIRWITTQENDLSTSSSSSSSDPSCSSKADVTYGDLHFYVNGVDQGVAATNVPANIYAVVDVYGRCAQVTIIDHPIGESPLIPTPGDVNKVNRPQTQLSSQDENQLSYVPQELSNNAIALPTMTTTGQEYYDSRDNEDLIFQSQCSPQVIVSIDCRTATRCKSAKITNSVCTIGSRPIMINEIFQVRLNEIDICWSGSIELGLIATPPAIEKLPTSLKSLKFCWVFSESNITYNCQTVMTNYGHIDMDCLSVGDVIGMAILEDSTLHFYINGHDLGVASENIPQTVYPLINLSGRIISVTIVDSVDDVPLRERTLTKSESIRQRRSGVINCRNYDDAFSVSRDSSLSRSNLSANSSYMTGSTSDDDSELNSSNSSSTCTDSDNDDENSDIAPGTARLSVIHQTLDRQSSINKINFHNLHGYNVVISGDGLTASRPYALNEFNNAVVLTDRPLRNNELFEVAIEKMIDRWSGSIEIGATLVKPTELKFPDTMTDVDYSTWMLSGASVMQNGSTISSDYPCDLDKVKIGVYGVIDLYGQCAQVSICNNSIVCTNGDTRPSTQCNVGNDHNQNIISDREEASANYRDSSNNSIKHSFRELFGKNITLFNQDCSAVRSRSFNHGILFSKSKLENDEMFEIRIDEIASQWSGSIEIGVTSCIPSLSTLPPSATELQNDTWMITAKGIISNGKLVEERYIPSLDRLNLGDRLGVMRKRNLSLHFFLNGTDMGITASTACANVFAVVDLYGKAKTISIVSSNASQADALRTESRLSSYIEAAVDEIARELAHDLISMTPSNHSVATADGSEGQSENGDSQIIYEADESYAGNFSDSDSSNSSLITTDRHKSGMTFYYDCAKNIIIKNDGQTAERCRGYDHAVVVSQDPLLDNKLFQVKIDTIDEHWSGAIAIGVTGLSPKQFDNISTAVNVKLATWVISDCSVYRNSVRTVDHYCTDLKEYTVTDVIGIICDEQHCLHLYINGVDQGVAAENMPPIRYALVDLYGKCKQVTILPDNFNSKPLNDVGQNDLVETINDNVVKERHSCDYMDTICKFRSSLGLPQAYFVDSDDSINCFCISCCDKRNSTCKYFYRGNPPLKTYPPKCWCRFTLRLPPKLIDNVNLNEWYIGYYPSTVGNVRQILDNRILATGNEDDYDRDISVSTNICHIQEHVEISQFRHEVFGLVSVAFEVYIKPDATTIADIEGTGDQCSMLTFKHSPRNMILSALLIKLESSSE